MSIRIIVEPVFDPTRNAEKNPSVWNVWDSDAPKAASLTVAVGKSTNA